MTDKWKLRLSGAAAGLVNGLFGGGGGMALVPLLTRWCGVEEKKAFATCVAVIFPICLISAAFALWQGQVSVQAALPYLLGGLGGGLIGGATFEKVSVRWLKVIFALFLLYGGVRYLL